LWGSIMEIRNIPRIPYAYEKHPLIDHLLGTARVVQQIVKGYKLDTVATYRLKICFKRSGIMASRLDREIMRELFYYTSLIHDIGKAAIEYQKAFSEDGIPKRHANFYLHEIPSAIICYKALVNRGFEEEISRLGALAVLMHMSAARNPFFLNFAEVKKRFPRGWNLKPYSETLTQALKVRIVDRISFLDAREFMELMKIFVSDINNKFVKIYSIILSPLIAGDNIDASRARLSDGSISPSRRKLMDEFLKIFKISGGEI